MVTQIGARRMSTKANRGKMQPVELLPHHLLASGLNSPRVHSAIPRYLDHLK